MVTRYSIFAPKTQAEAQKAKTAELDRKQTETQKIQISPVDVKSILRKQTQIAAQRGTAFTPKKKKSSLSAGPKAVYRRAGEKPKSGKLTLNETLNAISLSARDAGLSNVGGADDNIVHLDEASGVNL